MKIQKKDLQETAEAGIITQDQATRIWEHLTSQTLTKPNFTFLNVVYYFGALIIISAMTWFAIEAFSRFHGAGLSLVFFAYIALFVSVGSVLVRRSKTYIPGGLLLTAAVFVVPLFVFAIQKHFNIGVFKNPGDYNSYYKWISSGWFMMEIATIVTAVLFIFLFKFPFLTFPLLFTLWVLSMDITSILFGTGSYLWDEGKIVSVIFGVIVLLTAFIIDRRTRRDYSFWLYLFGLAAFWSGLTFMESNSEWSKLFYCFINLLLILLSVLLKRKVFIVFGAIGVYAYLYHLSSEVFRDSILFPIILSILGLSIIAFGILYGKYHDTIERCILKAIPAPMLNLLPPFKDRAE